MKIDGSSLTLQQAVQVIYQREHVEIDDAVLPQIRASRKVISDCLAEGKPVYGINTGFGKLADVRISDDHLDDLQRNLVLSHACGVGQPLFPEAVRAVLLCKANTLAKGHSGVREQVIRNLLSLLNHNILPIIPEQGSVGASGDLAPLAHMSLLLIGEGEALTAEGVVPAVKALNMAGIEPLKLQAKEGLALLNGTHFMTGLGVINWHLGSLLAETADIIGAMAAEALLCTPVAFDDRIHKARGYRGQRLSAGRLRKMMAGSPIRESHLGCSRVQDPYSVRCMPQVHGAVCDTLEHIAGILSVEINAATDNPLIFIEEKEILSGGNFHGHPVSTVMDMLGIVVSHLSAMSERRVAFMMDSAMSELPPFLVRDSGINSGFMIAQVSAAALASENKVLAHPASVDSIPTSANKEDFVTMGASAAVKGNRIVMNTAHVLAVELICACQALEFRAPLQPGPASRRVLDLVRSVIPTLKKDRRIDGDIKTAAELIISGQVLEAVEDLIA